MDFQVHFCKTVNLSPLTLCQTSYYVNVVMNNHLIVYGFSALTYFLSSSLKGPGICFQCHKTQAISFQIQNAVDIIGRKQEDQLFALL